MNTYIVIPLIICAAIHAYEPPPDTHMLGCGIAASSPHRHSKYSRKIDIAEAPWTLLLKIPYIINPKLKSLCGAALIRSSVSQEESDIVITAAHCVYNRTLQLQLAHRPGMVAPLLMPEVIAGMSDKESPDHHSKYIRKGRTIFIGRLFIQPTIDSMDDIAVIVLNEPLKFVGSKVSPICLPPSGWKIKPGQSQCSVTGYGNRPEGHIQTTKLQSQDAVNFTDCHTNYLCGVYSFAHDYHWQNRLCVGDSGSPLGCPSKTGRFYLAGVANGNVGHTVSNTQTKIFDLHTRIEHFLDDIKYIICHYSKVKGHDNSIYCNTKITPFALKFLIARGYGGGY